VKLASVSIDRRFRGPPDSGNGGYVVGLLARFAPEPVAVRLLVPPPLDAALEVLATDGGGLELVHGERRIATAAPDAVELKVPAAPGPAAARAASARYAGFRDHPFPGCFVCGPGRAAGDGLRVFAGPLEGGAQVASPWQPDESLGGTRGRVRPEFLAAALDCPGYFAVADGSPMMLLGSMALRIEGSVAVGEPCVVLGWSLGISGRKRRAATAVYGADGECVARAVSVWVELKPGNAVGQGAPGA